MSDPKQGILFFVPTDRIAGSDPPGAEGTKDLKFFGPAGRDGGGIPNNYSVQNVSQIAAELSDYHLDVGKTMGIRRIIFQSFATRIQAKRVVDLGGTTPVIPEVPGLETPHHFQLGTVGDAPNQGSIFGFPNQPDGGVGWQAANAIIEGLRTVAGAAQVNTVERRNRTFTPDQFLLLNLNFKSPIASTSSAQTRWTFATKAAREADGVFINKDIGKVALQDDEKSWWVLTALAPVGGGSTLKKPTWESQDLRSQIVGGCYNNRIVLFFLPDGNADPHYALIAPFYAYPGERDIKDQRHLQDIRGDNALYGWIEKARRFGSTLIPDTAFGAGFTTGVNLDIFGGYPPQNWMDMIVNAAATPTAAGLAPRSGGLGIFDSLAALNAAAASFKKSDIGQSAFVLSSNEYPHGYSPPTTRPSQNLRLTSVNPPVFASATLGGYLAQADGASTDTPYQCYLFPDNPHADFNYGGHRDVDQTYDSPFNPKVNGTFRVTNHEIIFGGFVTARFLNTD